MEYLHKLEEAFSSDLTDYKSIPFWSWNNELDEAELVRQIEKMHEANVGGFIMHARTGLKIDYLAEKWFSCISACLKKARELKMNAWIYDENGWPSGFVGGKLLENEAYRARFLRYEVTETYDPTAFAVYEETPTGFVRLKGEKAGVTAYHTIRLMVSPANTDILDPEVVDAFIRETHEKYYERFPDSFGRELVGFFTDEPQYYRYETPYTKGLHAEFAKDGEDVMDGLPYLFLHDERGYAFRVKYYTALNKLYVENYYKKLYDWCSVHNCKLTGHSIEEVRVSLQMLGGAGVMPTYEYEHIPAIDQLGRGAGTLASRQIGSVASQLGVKHVLTETYACCGYDVTPKELRHVGETQYFNGVTMTCQHLYPYSLALQGKYDYPPVFSPHGNWFEGFRVFNDYFNRLGYLIANTEERSTVALIHPLRGVYLEFVRKEERKSVQALEDSFDALVNALRDHGVSYQFVDERILARHGRVEKGVLHVGKRAYTTVIVPDMKTLSASTYEALQAYEGKLYLAGEIQYIDGVKTGVNLVSNTTLNEIYAGTAYPFEIRNGSAFVTYRSGELGDYIFLKNLSRTENAEVVLTGVSKDYKKLDLETLKTENVSDEITLGGAESAILVKDETARSELSKKVEENVTTAFRCTGISQNYLVLDYAEMRYDGREWTGRRPLQSLFDELLRADYKGEVRIRQRFTVKKALPLTLVSEKLRYTSVTVNGKPVHFTQSAFDVNFVEAEIGEMILEGENVFEYTLDWYEHDGVRFALFDPLATESLRNCLYYDASLENAYLKGDFTLDGDFAIVPRETLPTLGAALQEHGYPFFKGEIVYEGSVKYDGESRTELCLDGKFLLANVEINGKELALVLDEKKDVTDVLQKGENKIKIRLKISLRNLIGPHHSKAYPAPIHVYPTLFTFRAQWRGEECGGYTHEYNLAPVGLDRVILIKRP